ncbi:hypothetical protein Pcinc_012364 [Petrolisthes cinctipes]|uniref:Peptidase A2 domain-containing protein n=1 Tax=Petrolisthes cinctipes TaxID=88211 RepID=A0AAE1KTN1_PETCI|nr:hypothetical protein Pcinc_012364 [Petrolisthes cinctipes]
MQQHLSPPSTVTTPGRRSLLWIQDRLSGMHFLIDTGAALSLVPAHGGHARTGHPSYDLVAANGTPIATYGIQSRHLALAPNHTFQWNFLVADVGQPILGADFLSSHNLLVDTTPASAHQGILASSAMSGRVSIHLSPSSGVRVQHHTT